jgi:hypothetical protein
MKLTQKYMQCGVLAMLTAIAGLSLTSCEDEPDKYEVAGGVPTVRYVRSPLVTAADSLLNSAYTGTTVCLVGDNLRSIYELYFNDQKAILNTSYMTDNTVIVDIPKTIPALKSDKIYMVTQANDTVTYNFEVNVPAPEISSMSCEYAPAGSTVTLTGDYFVNDPGLPLTVTFPGNVVVKDFTSVTQNAITFKMPQVDEEGIVQATSLYGTGKSVFHYKDTRGLMFEFDGVTGLGNHGWHNANITSDDTSISGNFVQLGNGSAKMTESGGWDDSNFAFEYWPGAWTTPVTYPEREGIRLTDLVDFSDYQNMAIKFELYVPKAYPWKAGALQVIMAGVDKVSYGAEGLDVDGNSVPGCNNWYFNDEECESRSVETLPRALYRPWTTDGSFDTGDEWITVSLPIASSFVYNMSGGSPTGTLTQDDFASLVLFLVSGGVKGTECTPVLKIDNIRAVSIK